MERRVFNFSPGPGMLPDEVLERIRDELLDWHDTGMSVLEMSHRGTAFRSILEDTEAKIRRLLDIPTNYRVLFLQGGGHLQFAMVPLNLLSANRSADYSAPDTGRSVRSRMRDSITPKWLRACTRCSIGAVCSKIASAPRTVADQHSVQPAAARTRRGVHRVRGGERPCASARQSDAGVRASLYDAMQVRGVERLIAVMFGEQTHG